MRSLKEGQVQNVRVEALENDAKEQAERFQDYGFTGNPVDGQGLAMTIDGHTLVVRMDRLAERPHLNAFEVCMWHKDGHKVTMNNNSIVMHHLEGHEVSLKTGQLVQVDCQKYVVNASVSAKFNTPVFESTGQTFTANASSGANLNTPLVQASNSVNVANNCSIAGTTTAAGLNASGPVTAASMAATGAVTAGSLSATGAVTAGSLSVTGAVSIPDYVPPAGAAINLNNLTLHNPTFTGVTKTNGTLQINGGITSAVTDIIVEGADVWIERQAHITALDVGDPADPAGSVGQGGGSGGHLNVFVPVLFNDNVVSSHVGFTGRVVDGRHEHTSGNPGTPTSEPIPV